MLDRQILEYTLRQNSLFASLNKQQMDEICNSSRTIKLKENEVLFNQGDRAEYFYFVLDGIIKLYRHSPDGQEKIFELESSGRVFAEALMFQNNETYPVSASALQKSTVIAISSNKFLSIIKQSMDTCMMVMGDLSRRLHGLISEIERLSLLTGRSRVATYILEQYLLKGKDIQLDIPKIAISAMLALQPETFSRLLKELSNEGIIKVKDTHIHVLDQEKLRIKAGISQQVSR
jgi:CRP-like cAMP-binding protein